jgi:hypothetical protein
MSNGNNALGPINFTNNDPNELSGAIFSNELNSFFFFFLMLKTKRAKSKIVKKAKNLVHKELKKDEQDLELEEIVFGKDRVLPIVDTNVDSNSFVPDLGFFIDESGEHNKESMEMEKEIEVSAWKDTDDSFQVDIDSVNRLKKLKTSFDEKSIKATEYENRLREQFKKMHPTPSWAEIPNGNQKDEEIDSVFQTTNPLVSNALPILDPDTLRVRRVADANVADYSHVFVANLVCYPSCSFSS